MRPLPKAAVCAGAALLLLAAAAQMNWISFYYSQLGSSTSQSEFVKERHGDLVSKTQIDRPLWRWVPFVKVGNTVYRHSAEYARDQKTVLERESVTRTHLVVIGLCSLQKYDQLADEPFEKMNRENRAARANLR